MQKKRLKSLVLAAVAAMAVGTGAAFSGCTIKTKHPRATITIEFNGEEYDIQYTLYRNMYPATVQHFIELADAGYYDNMIVHNYTSNDWFTGGYAYDEDDEELDYASAYSAGAMSEYLENNSKEQEYYDLFGAGKLSTTVYTQLSYNSKGKQVVNSEDALPTLIGEFTSNDHTIKKGALSASFGVLKMFYYSKGDTKQKVAIVNSSGEILEHDYQYNCATSIFAIQAGSSSSYGASAYCVFAQLRNDDAEEVLEDLQDAIETYIDDNLGGTSSKFYTSYSVDVDTLDTFAEEGGRNIETSFATTVCPLVIKTVKITKY